MTTDASYSGVGRPPVTNRADLEGIALAMFSVRGFEVTSVEEIAAAAGISRRTFFRYFRSKNDVVWGDFDTQIARFRMWFDRCPPETPIMEAIKAGVIAFNSFEPLAMDGLRARMRVILSSPALQAYSTVRYHSWREVIVEFVAFRLSLPETDLVPRVLGHLALGAALAAYEQWLATDGTELTDLLDRSLGILISRSV